MNSENDMTRQEQQALDIVEAGQDISEAQLSQLRRDDQLRQDVQALLELRSALHSQRQPLDVDARLKLFHATHLEPAHRTAKPLVVTLLAAAAVFLGVLLMIFTHDSAAPSAEGNLIFIADAESAGVSIANEAGEQVALSPQTSQNTAITLASFHRVLQQTDRVERVTLSVPFGKSTNITLPDGSVAYLHPGSKLKFPTSFDGAQRMVILEGEAYFKVARDEAHPFVVMAGSLQTTVLGTEFNINTWQSEVTLISGSVRVSREKTEAVLTPGQQASFDSQQLSVTTVDVTPYEYWRDGYLYYDNVPLREIMEAIGRNFNMTVEFRNEDALELRMRFITERNNGVETALDMMNRMKKVRVFQEGGRIIVE